MTARNTLKLKELIFNTLNNDLTLRTLLGSEGRVRHANPQQLSEYPLVVYSVLEDVDNPYETDQQSGIANSRVIVQSFSASVDSAQSDALDDRVFALLDGQRLSNTSIQAYSIYRVSRTPTFESEVEVWNVASAYDLYNATI